MKSKLLTNKLEELIALARVESETNVAIILLALNSARELNDEDDLALIVQDFVREVLLPRVEDRIIAKKIALN